jgi:dihydroorotase
VGAPADVTIIDPAARWTVAAEQFRSKSTNTPLAGQELTGRVLWTLVDGEIRYQAP